MSCVLDLIKQVAAERIPTRWLWRHFRRPRLAVGRPVLPSRSLLIYPRTFLLFADSALSGTMWHFPS